MEIKVELKKYTEEQWVDLVANRLLNSSYLTRGETVRNIKLGAQNIDITFIAPMKRARVGRKIRPRQLLYLIHVSQEIDEKDLEDIRDTLISLAKEVAQEEGWVLNRHLYIELPP